MFRASTFRPRPGKLTLQHAATLKPNTFYEEILLLPVMSRREIVSIYPYIYIDVNFDANLLKFVDYRL